MQKCQSAIEPAVCWSAHQHSAHTHTCTMHWVMAWRGGGGESADCQLLAMTQHRLQTTARRDGTPRPSRIAAYTWQDGWPFGSPADRHYQVSGPAPRAARSSRACCAHAGQGRARPPTDGRTDDASWQGGASSRPPAFSTARQSRVSVVGPPWRRHLNIALARNMQRTYVVYLCTLHVLGAQRGRRRRRGVFVRSVPRPPAARTRQVELGNSKARTTSTSSTHHLITRRSGTAPHRTAPRRNANS